MRGQYPQQQSYRPQGPRTMQPRPPHGHQNQQHVQQSGGQQQPGAGGGPQQQQQQQSQVIRHQGQQMTAPAATYSTGHGGYGSAPMIIYGTNPQAMQQQPNAMGYQIRYATGIPGTHYIPSQMIPNYYTTLPLQQVHQAQQQPQLYYQHQGTPVAQHQGGFYQQPIQATYRPVVQAVPVAPPQVQQQQQQQQQSQQQPHVGAQHHNQQQSHQPQPQQQQQLPPVSIQSIVAPVVHQQPPEQREPLHIPPQPRKKKILQIVDPNTGKSVIDEEVRENAPSVSPQPTVEHVGSGPNDNYPEESGASIINNNTNAKPGSGTGAGPGQDEKSKGSDDSKDRGSNIAKAAFYQAITRLADEDKTGGAGADKGRTSSTPEAVPTPLVAQSTSPVPTQAASTQPPPITVASSAPPAPTNVPIIKDVPAPFPMTSAKEEETENVPVQSGEIIKSITPEPEPSSIIREPVNVEVVTTGESTPSLPATPTNLSNISSTSRGGGDDTTDKDASLVSISPTPMDKYDALLDTPEKLLPPSTTPTIESGEPSSVGSSTRESTASPSLNLTRDRDDVCSTKSSDFNVETIEVDVNKKQQRLEETESPASSREKMNNLTKSLDNISIDSESTATAQSQPQLKGVQNGENESDECRSSEDDEEGQREEGEIDEDSETSEPPKKTRITYDKSALLMFQPKPDSLDMNSIPPELIKDGKSNHMGFRGSSPGGFGSSRPGAGSRGRSDKMGGGGGMHPGMRGQMPQMSMQWNMGMGGMVIPPPPPRPPKVIEISRQKVELHKAKDAWKPSTAGRPGKPDDRSEDQILTDDVVKKTRSILNKLTPENFDKLIDKFLQLQLEDNDDRIGAVIRVVFEKAIDEPSFSTAYAKMVAQVCGKSAETSKKFRKKILDQCQKEFQTGNSDEEALRELESKYEASTDEKEKQAIKIELDEKKFMSRRRSLGNVRFIGELYKFAMLTPKIMVECINMLLQTQDEENLECLCKLLTTIGQKVDEALRDIEIVAKSKSLKWIPEPSFMDKTFQKLKDLSKQNSLSSRIRFALLDVCELRDNGWKPRRDANAPKTIDEVRRAAAREELEEKKQLMSLPSAQPLSSSSQSQPPRLMNQQPKKGEGWQTVKSSRFENTAKNRKPQIDSTSDLPKFAPGGGGLGWGRPGGGSSGLNLGGPGGLSSSSHNKPPPFEKPPRFSRLDVDRVQGPPPTREEIVQEPPPPMRTPISSSHSSRESSRPQTPIPNLPTPTQSIHREIPTSQPQNQIQQPKENNAHGTADNHEATKNIFQEFVQVRSVEDTIGWIQDRFPRTGSPDINDFVEELGNLVCDLTKEDQQKTAAVLLKLLIKRGLISKNEVIKTLQTRVVSLLPDMEVDIPKVTSYFAVFLVELFLDENDLSWLLQIGEELSRSTDPDDSCSPTTWPDLVTNTLQIFKLRRNEESVKSLYKNTPESNKLPTQNLLWIASETVDSLSEKMKKVLEEKQCQNVEHILAENSWDLREELTIKSLIEAICSISWKPETSAWDLPILQQLLSEIKFPDRSSYTVCWQQAKEFIKLHNVDKSLEEELWVLMVKNNLISNDTRRTTN